jgi:secondary thiamine-phosphate synthase enzyme
MAAPALPIPQPAAARLSAWSCTLELRTPGAMDFVDLTDRLAACVEHAGIEHGILNAQCLHTSAALLVNENEPLLHDDFRALLGRWAPRGAGWQHDRFEIRTVNLAPGEQPNGHAHARALVLRSAECLNVVGGRLSLGRWQRVFLLECDEARDRSVSVMVLGVARCA